MTDDAIDRVRRLGRELEEAHPGLPDPDALRADERLREGVTLLDGASNKRLAKLISGELPAVAAIAAVVVGKQERVGPRLMWAMLNSINLAPPGLACLMLQALANAGGPNVAGWTLARLSGEGWLAEPRRSALRAFVAARVKLGERLPSFDSIDQPLIDLVRDLLPAGAGGMSNTASIDEAFFNDLGRMVDTRTNIPLLRVGPRPAVLQAIVRAVEARRSVLIVGDHGVGKGMLARKAVQETGNWRAFEATAAAVNAGMMYIGQLEGRVKEIAQHMQGRRIAWLFPDLEDAIWAGQHNRSERGMLDALLPHVEAGDTVVIGQLSEKAYEQLVRLRPKVAGAFEVVRLPELGREDTLKVARDWLQEQGATASDETLGEAYDLADHYLANIAAPGSVLRLLAQVLERGVAVEPGALLDTLSETTGLSLDLLDPRTRLDLAATRGFFEERVLGQPEAVDCVVERIALIKAGLTDPTRPLGVFLFVGPTGTGKTELAKATAELLFGSEERLVRLDMSEYQTYESLDRLLADTAVESDGAQLISSVRAQPFSVVLLDEFEKAHRAVWDLFLAVFDDGRLTDRGGRTTDFRHCVIILTSNIGSALPSGPGLGFSDTSGGFQASGVERALRAAFRPELLNRFDRTVVFRPLGRDVMRALLEHELNDVLDRRGFRSQPWAVEWDEAALDYLLERGYTAELGARPMKRAIEQHLLAPLAVAIVERAFPEGDQFLFIGVRGDALEVSFVDPDAPAEPVAETAPPGYDDVAAAVAQALAGKDAALAATREPGFWDLPQAERAPVLERVEYLDRLQAAWQTAERLRGRGAARLLAERLHVLAAACAGLAAGDPSDTVLRITPSRGADGWAAELREMYERWARARGMRVQESENGALLVAGLGAHTILAPETGLHVYEEPHGSKTRRLTVQVLVGEAEASRRIVRRYQRLPSPLVRDAVRGWRTGRIERVLAGEFDMQA